MGTNVLTILRKCTESQKPCEWPDFIALLNELIQFGIYLAIMFATLTIAFAGFKILTAAGNSSQISAGKSMMWNAVLGIIIVLIAWLGVQYILTTIGLDPNYSVLKN